MVEPEQYCSIGKHNETDKLATRRERLRGARMTTPIAQSMALSATDPIGSKGSLQEVKKSAPKMQRQSKEGVRLALYCALLALDMMSISVGIMIGNVTRFSNPIAGAGIDLTSLLLPLYAIIAFSTRSYAIDVLQDVQVSVFRGLRAFLLTVSALLIILFTAKVSAELSRTVFLVGIPASALILGLVRHSFGGLVGRYHDWTFVREVLIVDGVTVRPRRGQIVVFSTLSGLSPSANDPDNYSRIGVLLENCDHVLIACRAESRVAWAQALKGSGVPVEVLTPELDHMGAFGIRRVGGRSAVLVAPGSLGFRDRSLKRALDLSVAVPALILFLPVLLSLAVAIKLTSPGPVIFRQPRLGQGNKIFRVLKFRTMRVEATDTKGALSTRQSDDRVTRVGQFLRRSSLDELPQLLNVIKGEMSIVGPRPHALGSTAGEYLFWHIDQRYWQRAAVRPGITGLAQVRGFRGATQCEEDLRGRLQADLEYLSDWSMWKDLVIILKTSKVLVHSKAY